MMQKPRASSTRKRAPRAPREWSTAGIRTEEETDVPYLHWGISAGCLGAFVVAVFYLCVDWLAGHPLATPNTLGGALFLGKDLERSSALSAPLVLGYTLVHGVVFVAMGSIAATALLSARRLPASRWSLMLCVAGALFAGLELFFTTFTLIVAPFVRSQFSTHGVAIANLLAAGVMALWLTLGTRHERRIEEGALADRHREDTGRSRETDHSRSS